MTEKKQAHYIARVLHWGIALALTLLLAGCTGFTTSGSTKVEDLSATTPVEIPVIEVLGVDFDPPLDYMNTLHGQGITLLVAVENQGSVAVQDVRILARVHLGNGEEQVIERHGLIQELPPGQVVVYRFPRLHTLPMRRSYTLEIHLLSADGLQVFGQRTYTVNMAGEQRLPQPSRLRAPGR